MPLAVLMILRASTPTRAQSAEEMAKMLQDPSASSSALMTDSTVNFETGDDDGAAYHF